MTTVDQLHVKVFADGADLAGMQELYRQPHIKGFTTNPTLMRKAGISDYRAFAHQVLQAIPDRPISFEVFSDDFAEMHRQAREIASWGPNVYVKVPITNTRREPAIDLVHRLSGEGVNLNVTALMTLQQVTDVAKALDPRTPACVSVFAGRIADTGVDPVPLMTEALERLSVAPKAELIWASPRELLNVFQADAIGCHIITVTNDILKKLSLVGRDLADYSLDTVKMFHDDAAQAGFALWTIVSAAVSLAIVLATLAFGGVYPWGYLPIYAFAVCVGVAGLGRARGLPRDTGPVAVGLLIIVVAIGAQLLPLPRSVLDFLTPHTSALLAQYNLVFAAGGGRHAISINPGATALALLSAISLGLYAIGLAAVLSRHDLRAIPAILAVFAVLLALGGIFGREHSNGLVYGFWRPEEKGAGDFFGPFINRNHFAGWMVMTLSLCIGALCGRIESSGHLKPGFRNRIVWFSSPEASQLILMAGSVIVMAVSLVWTLSRSGIISFAMAVLCFMLLVAAHKAVTAPRRIAAIATIATALLAGLSLRGVDQLGRWFADPADLISRSEAWRDGWKVVQDFPLAGTGFSTYPDAMLFYQKHVVEFWMTHAHNDYLQLFAEGGLLVSLPVLVTLIALGLTVVKRLGQLEDDAYGYWACAGAAVGLVAIAVQETVEFSLHMPANALLFATLVAVAIAPVRRSHRAGVESTTATRPLLRRVPVSA